MAFRPLVPRLRSIDAGGWDSYWLGLCVLNVSTIADCSPSLKDTSGEVVALAMLAMQEGSRAARAVYG